MFLRAGWTALPGRIGRGGGGGKDESLHLFVDLGGSPTVTSPPGREGGLGQISLNTDFLSFLALCSTSAMLQHVTRYVTLFANPVFRMDNKTAYGRRKTYGLDVFMLFTVAKHSLPLASTLAQLILQLQWADLLMIHITVLFTLHLIFNCTHFWIKISNTVESFSIVECLSCVYVCLNMHVWPWAIGHLPGRRAIWLRV